jgi:hypothetical protein
VQLSATRPVADAAFDDSNLVACAGRFTGPRQSQAEALLVADALATVRKLHTPVSAGKVLVRADSAFYAHPAVVAAIRGGADVSVTVRLDPKVRAAIGQIPDDGWTTIEYTDAVFDETSGIWVSRAEVGEIPFTALSSRKTGGQVSGRLVVRRIPDLNAKTEDGQATLFDTWGFHAFNLTRAAATITRHRLAKATTATIRRTLITVPANWPWETAWTELFTRVCGPPNQTHAGQPSQKRRDRTRPSGALRHPGRKFIHLCMSDPPPYAEPARLSGSAARSAKRPRGLSRCC